MENTKAKIITNLITLTRIVGVIFLIPIYNHFGGRVTFFVTLFCFFTDLLDGFIARHYHAATFFGGVFDSVSDKLFLIMNMILLIHIDELSLVLILLEVGIAVVQYIKYRKNLNVKSSIFGKIKMWIAGINIPVCYWFSNGVYDYPLFRILLIPVILIDSIVFLDYFIGLFIHNEKVVKKQVNKDDFKNIKFREFFFSNKFYLEYKDYDNLKLIKDYLLKK